MPRSTESGEFLRDPVVLAMLDAGGIALWDADLLAETTVYQAGFWERYGYDPQRLTETFDFLSVVHSRDRRTIARAWREHVEGETEIYEAKWRLRTASGEWRWIQARGKVVERDAAGIATRMVGAYVDITSSRQSELDLQESTAELEAVFRSSRDGLAVISPSHILLRANEAALEHIERFTGVRLAEGDSIARVPPFAADRPIITDLTLALAGRTDLPTRTVPGITEAGWLEFSYSPVFDADGLSLGVAITIRDITEKTRSEEARLQTLRLESMGLMASGFAHDFNNMIGAIVGNIDLATLTAADPETVESLTDARAATRRASELVQQLLAFAGDREPIVNAVDIAALTTEIVRYAKKIPNNRVPIRVELPAGLPRISGDANQLRQMLLNLLVNALDATSESGSAVEVRARVVRNPREVTSDLIIPERPAENFIALEIRDDGPGMNPETRERLFDPFYTTKPTGHGLGLPSVLSTVRNHGGTLAVHSEPGRGACFTVFLPVN